MENKSMESFRSSHENDKEWSLRKTFLENNFNKFPKDRLVCLSMCFINNVSYGVTYPPGVMSKLKELSQGLPTHLDIVKEKNSIAFVKSEEKSNTNNNCKYGHFVKSNDSSNKDNNGNDTKPTTSKYSNFIHSSEASYQKTYDRSGAGLGYGGTGGAGLGFGGAGLGFETAGSMDDPSNSKSGMNSNKYAGFIKSGSTGSSNSTEAVIIDAPNYSGGTGLGFRGAGSADESTNTNSGSNSNKYSGFVKSGSTASENSKSCFSTTENVSNMFDNTNFTNSNASSNNSKYMKMMKTPPTNSNVGSQPQMLSNKYRRTPPQVSHMSPPPAKKAHFSTAAPKSTYSTSDVQLTCLEKKFYALSECVRTTKAANPVQLLNIALSKVKLLNKADIKPSIFNATTIFKCTVQIADVSVGEGSARTKKAARLEAFNKALDQLKKPTLKIESRDGEQILVGSDQPCPQRNRMIAQNQANSMPNNKQTMPRKPMSSWGTFLIMENKLANSAIATIRHSVDFNKMPLAYNFTPDPQGVNCQLLINEEPIVECVDDSKTSARIAASEKAVAWLKERCWTIVIKQSADSGEIDVSRENIMGEIEKQSKPIGSDNIGNQLLRKMGWEGGGIGAEGNKGIADPIQVNQVIDRQGLGCRSTSGVSSKFDVQIRDVLLRYAKSKKQEDLVFTAEFTKDERAIIHNEARRYNLKSTSRGGGNDRYMIISRKRSAGQLFNHILSSGGSTQKYELIPPLNPKT